MILCSNGLILMHNMAVTAKKRKKKKNFENYSLDFEMFPNQDYYPVCSNCSGSPQSKRKMGKHLNISLFMSPPGKGVGGILFLYDILIMFIFILLLQQSCLHNSYYMYVSCRIVFKLPIMCREI